MAKYKPSKLFEKLKGSIGDITFFDSKYGSQIRSKPIPKNKRTPAQRRVRNYQTKATQAWTLVNTQQVMTWKAFALRFPYKNNIGEKVYYTGRTMFIKCNRSLLEISQPIILDPPKNTKVQALNSIDVDILISGNYYDIKLLIKPALNKNTKLLVFATAFIKPGINTPKSNKYKEIAVLDSTFISGSSILDYYNKVFLYQNYNSFKIAFRFKAVSSISGFCSKETSFIEEPIFS